MRRGIVQIKVIFLYVFAVIAFAVSQAEEPFFENRVLAVPQRQREAEVLFIIGNSGDAVLAPAVGTRAGLLMGKEIPRVTPRTIVFAYCPPLALTEVRTPLFPIRCCLARFLQTCLFFCHGEFLSCMLFCGANVTDRFHVNSMQSLMRKERKFLDRRDVFLSDQNVSEKPPCGVKKPTMPVANRIGPPKINI